jgi:protein HEXIM1/2
MSEMEERKTRRESEASPRSESSSERAEDATPGKKRRHRRGKHRRRAWKPYSKMTPEERQQAESREAARAARRERNLMGKPAAPWNTTQFIMEDHETVGEMNLSTSSVSRTISVGSSASDEDAAYESPEESGVESGVFWNRDYENVVAELEEEELRGLSQAELVQRCLQLREEVRRLREEKSSLAQMPVAPSATE